MKKTNLIIGSIIIATIVMIVAIIFGTNTEQTNITGFPTIVNSTFMKDEYEVIIENCGKKREAELQIQENGKFVTIEKYALYDKKSSKIKVSFPSSYMNKTNGIWRLYVKSKGRYSTAISNECKVVSSNIKKLNIKAKTACVYCVDDDVVIYNKAMNKKRKQASTTKVMTALLLLESGKIDDVYTVSKHTAHTPYSNIYMKKKDKYLLHDLLYALMLKSSNDSAVAISEAVAGSEKNFVVLMNERAKGLGLVNTNFETPNGLDGKNHFTTAYELAKLMGYTYSNYREFRHIIIQDKYTFKSLKNNEVKMVRNTDGLHGYKNHKGGKTGFTSGAKYTYVSVYELNGKTYVISLLGNDTTKQRWKDAKILYKYIDNYANEQY